jgi:hypothetical protein
VLRVGAEAREASAVGVIREMVLEALQELAEGRWVPWEAIAGFVRTDSRTAGLTRLLDRWAGRCGIEPMTPAELAHRIAFESLHVLGVVDLGDVDDDTSSDYGPTLRLTPRGRVFLGMSESASTRADSRFLDTQALRVGPQAFVGEVLALSSFVEIGRVAGNLDVIVTQAAVARALGAGVESDTIQARLRALASLPDPISRVLAQASAVLGRAEYVACEGFVWVDDPEVRELLRTRRQTADLFVDPSPPGGLLLAPGVDVDRAARRCRALGVEVLVEGAVYRSRSTAPPRRASYAPASSDGPAKARSTNGAKRRASGTRRKQSSASMPASKRKGGTG